MTVQTINLEPDPRILLAITNNPMRPIDALCELVDNSIDSFSDAAKSGQPVESPTISIGLPRATDIERSSGAISVLDNGPGLSISQTQDALRAGFTSRHPFDDTLGLFGMGFNISTGKLGRSTLFRTSTKDADEMIEVIIDLEEMVKSHSYDVPVEEKKKEPPNFYGTFVQISEWWPAGSQNQGFALKLIRLGNNTIREELGRRYYPLLRDSNLRIFVNDDLVAPFEHCVWADHRSLRHQNLGQISAVYRFDEVLNTQVWCTGCYSMIQEGTKCPKCGTSSSLRTVEERVRGWVGIQRFDDTNHYGIDLIRRGRVIKKFEQTAFFTWTDANDRQIKDYPVDGVYGRIVGEVHLDHVPTDFLKQDFQRTSPEWNNAMNFLRGQSSLQPRSAAEAGEPPNDSPIYRLYQGYRRVRDVGTADIYMGYWEPGADKAKRISRVIEKEYYEKFRNKEPGYYDDSEWWKLVEQADTRPTEELKECPNCSFQCLSLADVCSNCEHIFIGKTCINRECGITIPSSASICTECGWSQEIRPQDRWRCNYCYRQNPPDSQFCLGCNRSAGEINPLDISFLREHSHRSDELSIAAFSIRLPDNATCDSMDINVYTVDRGTNLEREGIAFPAVNFKGDALDLEIFIDTAHPVFSEYQQHPETVISMEIAKFIQDRNARYMTGSSSQAWSLTSLCWQILREYWREHLSVDQDRTRQRAEEFFEKVRQELPELLREKSNEIYQSMTPSQQEQLVITIVQAGYDAREIPSLVESGRYLSLLDNRTVANLVEKYPSHFFDGKFWSASYENIPIDDQAALDEVKRVILLRYRNFLEDIIGFLSSRHRDTAYTIWANSTLGLLTVNVVK